MTPPNSYNSPHTQRWIEGLRRYPTLAALHASPFFASEGAGIDAFLETPEVISFPGAVPVLSAFVRVVQWNIEKGGRFEAVLACLRDDPALSRADVVLLNEADRGMARSGNRHVAAELGRELGMHAIFGPAHIELGKGTGDDLWAPGENGESLQGNAILSRHAVLAARVVRLPVCFDPYEFHEKRYGGRSCLWARLLVGDRPVWVGSIHLEVRKTPGCRAAQMRHALHNLPGDPGEPHLLGGDLNSNGFRRGTRSDTIASAARLVLTPPGRMRPRLLRPELGAEPLFRIARAAGFAWQGLNSGEATASAPIEGLEDSALLPGFAARFVRRRLAPYGGYLRMKLDWLLARGMTPLGAGEARDPQAGVESLNPGCIPTECEGANRPSDHSPIFADLG